MSAARSKPEMIVGVCHFWSSPGSGSNGPHIISTLVPEEEPSTASKADLSSAMVAGLSGDPLTETNRPRHSNHLKLQAQRTSDILKCVPHFCSTQVRKLPMPPFPQKADGGFLS
jgi:hypothetical protein